MIIIFIRKSFNKLDFIIVRNMKLNHIRRKWSSFSLLDLKLESPQRASRIKNLVLKDITLVKKNFFHMEVEKDSRIINPESSLKLLWDFLVAVIILGDIIIIPIISSFPSEFTESFSRTETFTSILFLIDILLGLNTGYYENGHLNRSRSKILKQYIHRFLFPDILSIIPFRLIVSLTVYKYVMLLKLYRIIRLYNIIEIFEILLHSLLAMKIFYYGKKILTVLILLHWMSCLWAAISIYDTNHSYTTWLIQEPNDTLLIIYIKCLYFATATTSTLGYGDYYPNGTTEYYTSFIILVVGVIIFSFNITSLIDTVVENRKGKIDYYEKIISLNIYMKKKKLPSFLQFELRRFLEYTSNEKSMIHENQMLGLLSEPLREEIFIYTDAGKMIQNCTIFLEMYEGKIIRKLSKYMQNKVYAPNDFIVQEGDLTSELYFISCGHVEVVHSSTDSVFAVLGPKQFFGEIGFFSKKPRTSTVRCVEIVEVLYLKRKNLDNLLHKFPLYYTKTQNLEMACHENDFSALGIKCYLCKEYGHIASKCFNVTLNQDKAQENWIKSKRLSKIVRPKSYHRANAHRKAKNHIPMKMVSKIDDIIDFADGKHSTLAKKVSKQRLETIKEEDTLFRKVLQPKIQAGLMSSSEDDYESEPFYDPSRKRRSYRFSVTEVADEMDSPIDNFEPYHSLSISESSYTSSANSKSSQIL